VQDRGRENENGAYRGNNVTLNDTCAFFIRCFFRNK
jgi:hypothetical protein